jgi:hypothetical protein
MYVYMFVWHMVCELLTMVAFIVNLRLDLQVLVELQQPEECALYTLRVMLCYIRHARVAL